MDQSGRLPRDGRPGVVRRIPLPEFASEASQLSRIDYSDAFTVGTGTHAGRTAEQWARAILEGRATSLRRGWTALGLRVDDGAGVAGWRIRRNDSDTVLLSADSRVGMPGELLVA